MNNTDENLLKHLFLLVEPSKCEENKIKQLVKEMGLLYFIKHLREYKFSEETNKKLLACQFILFQ